MRKANKPKQDLDGGVGDDGLDSFKAKSTSISR